MADFDGTLTTEKVENVTIYKLNKKKYAFKKNGAMKKVSFQVKDQIETRTSV